MSAKSAKRATCMAIVVTAAAIVFPIEAYAQSTTHSVSVGGAGREACAAWTKARAGTTEEARIDSQKRVEWISGFMTAINMFNTPTGNLHGGIDDGNGMLSWIDARCQAQPDRPLFAVAAELVLDLQNHPRP